MPPAKIVKLFLFTVLVAAAVLPHIPSLTAGFTQDDHEFVKQNDTLYSVKTALGAFGDPFPANDPSRGLYRPVTALSYAVDSALFGSSPHIYHCVNLFFYTITVLLIYLLFRQIFGANEWAAFFAVLLFTLHPVHCEAVDSISGRSEILSLLFGVIALLIIERHFRYDTAWKWLWLFLSLFAFMITALSKETGLAFAGLILLYVFIQKKALYDRWYLSIVPFFVGALIYIVLRMNAIGAFVPSHTILGGKSITTHIYTIGTIFFEYARLLFWPTTLQVDAYYERTIGVQQEMTVRGAIGLILIAVLAMIWVVSFLRSLRSEGRRTEAQIVIGLGAFFLFWLPVSHLIPFGALMAERFLFAPSFGFALFIGAIVT